MPTTTNYGWTTPADTDLVKDGAAAIRTLGSSIDTTTKALNPSTTLGDIEYRSSTANTNTRLPLGTAGQVLKVNSGATAPEWATLASGGLTSLASGNLTGSSVTISSIVGTYKTLVLSVDNPYHTSQPQLALRFNGDSGASNYRWVSINTGNTSVNTGSAGSSIALLPNNIGANSTSYASAYVEIPNYALTTVRKAITSIGNYGDGSVPLTSFATGGWVSASAITSITILVTSNDFTGGTYTLYGAN